MTSVASSNEPRPKKPRFSPPLLLLDSRKSDFPTGSSESSVVPELRAPLNTLSDSDANSANEILSSSNTRIKNSSRKLKWWKRVTAMRRKRRHKESRVNGRNAEQELYVRSMLESFVSSMSSRDRFSTNFFVDDTSSSCDKKSSEQISKRPREATKTATVNVTTNSVRKFSTYSTNSSNLKRRDVRNSSSPAYMAHFTPNEDPLQAECRLDREKNSQLNRIAGAVGLSSGSSLGIYDDVLDDNLNAATSIRDEEDRRRLQRRLKVEAMRARLLEKEHQRSRARKKIGIFLVCIGVMLTAFVVASVWIAKEGVKIQNNSIDTGKSARISGSSQGSGSSFMEGSEADLIGDSSSLAPSDDDLTWSLSDSNNGRSVYTDSHTYVHSILMVLSLWMSLVVVLMHMTFRSFRTYSLPFALELSCVQCGYWITSLLRVMLSTVLLSRMTYLIFCVFECFFNFAQISFSCAIAFNMYRSVVSYVDVIMDSQSAKRRYRRCTMNVLLLSIVVAVTLALVGSRFRASYDPTSSSSAEEDTMLDTEKFPPCLNSTCRRILYVYYPLLAFAFNLIFYVRFKRTIGKSYPTSAIGRLNKVARSYLIVFFVCWGSLIILTALQVSRPLSVPPVGSFVMQSIFDILGVCTAAITFTNFHRCRIAFDFGLSLKAIDPNSIEFDDPVNIVGEGTFAIVLKARWRQGGHGDDSASQSIEVAVKTFKHAQMEYVEHVKEEAYLSSKLVHPCIMITYGCYTSGTNLYIVYEYLGGGTLQQLIDSNRNTPFTYERGLCYAQMIAVGMRFLHGLPVPIVHRDLKPLNCIFDSEHEMLKIADFGESRLLRTRDVVAPRPSFFPSADVTVQMTTNIGSACWAAPEVLKDEATSEYSVKIDVYSFGIICWQLYTCGVPYADIPGSVLAVAEAVLSGVRPLIPPDCPRLFAKIMERCWHDNPLRRPNFDDIVQLLERELTQERRRQLVRTQGRDVEVVAPPTLGLSNFGDSNRIESSDFGRKLSD